jgi:hypothetical protein
MYSLISESSINHVNVIDVFKSGDTNRGDQKPNNNFNVMVFEELTLVLQ